MFQRIVVLPIQAEGVARVPLCSEIHLDVVSSNVCVQRLLVIQDFIRCVIILIHRYRFVIAELELIRCFEPRESVQYALDLSVDDSGP